jgi:hypothetical protein
VTQNKDKSGIVGLSARCPCLQRVMVGVAYDVFQKAVLYRAWLCDVRTDLLFDVFDCGVDAAVQAKHSIYVLKLYKGLEWHYLILDDRFPVMVANNKPVFAHCEEDHEIWVPLIEKAFAKLHGTYDALISGWCWCNV